MVINLSEGSPDIIDMRTRPPPLAAWMKKQGEDLFKGWKRRYSNEREREMAPMRKELLFFFFIFC